MIFGRQLVVHIALCGFITFSFVSLGVAASVEKGTMLKRHGLTREAKSELIDVVFGKTKDQDKAEAYYLLGSISFDENNVLVALETWMELVKKFPNSPQAQEAEKRINQLDETDPSVSLQKDIENVIASSYIRHGDFWSEDKSNIFRIDGSWIPKVETAINWYDKVIADYPLSKAAEQAYEKKLLTILGWKEPGQYGDRYGIQESFAIYMPQLLDTFAAFERDHPTAPSLQAFRYQIVQVYWSKKQWAETREWLNLLISKSGEWESFYKDLAKRRLAKIEY